MDNVKRAALIVAAFAVGVVIGTCIFVGSAAFMAYREFGEDGA